MKKRALILAMITFIAAATSESSINMVRAEETQVEETQTEENAGQTSELPIKTLTPKVMDVNPYMAASDSNIHHDCYNTDSTDEVLPVDIYSEINVSYEKVNPNASPAVFFDSYGHAVVPLLGGLAIRDINAEETQTLGYFSPKQHDNGEYLIQSSYSFVDESNRLVCPTNNNHVLMLKATDEDGNVLPEFEKVLDIDIKAAAEAALGKTLDQNLLAVVFDYEGNLWFATGGFRIYPDRKQQGAMGYISRTAIDAILNGEETDLSEAVFVYELAPGEGAENGIAASKEGAVILTNLKCYLLQADNGVKKVWETSYKSVGAKESKEGDETTGGGLAWGGGCSPSLTKDLVMFTDNQDPVNLIAVDMKTGEQVASMPVIDELPEGTQVSVENSAIVYDDGEGTVSTIVCNWFGAGSAKLGEADNDSSIQSYENIYDVGWLRQGNKMIAPGIERVDTVKTEDGYEMKSIWCRSDLSDTSMMKLSTATGYIYGYVQDMETGMWQYIMLDFETGETAFTMDITIPADKLLNVLRDVTEAFHRHAIQNMHLTGNSMPRIRVRALPDPNMVFLSILFAYDYDHIQYERNFNLKYNWTVDKVMEYTGHEMEPGHLTYYEKRTQCFIDTGWPEMAEVSLYSPSSAFTEGSARYASDLCFASSMERKVEFEKEYIFKKAGLDDRLVEYMPLWHRFMEVSGYAFLEASRKVWDKLWTEEQGLQFLKEYGFMEQTATIEQLKAAISDPGHFVCHDYARDTIRRYFESTCSSIEEKWALYENLCSSHMSMTEIQSGIFKPDVYMWR